MDSTHRTAAARLTGVLLLTAFATMFAGAVIVVPSGLTLNPSEPAAALAAVGARPWLHLLALGLDVAGWLALAAGALTMAAAAPRAALLPAGLLAAAGLAGMLHDAGNLALTQLAADPAAPAATAVAGAVLLTAKWGVNLAGLLWVAATATAALHLPLATGMRRAGAVAALSGLVAVALPWPTGLDGPSPAQEQFGYALHLPVMVWWAVLGGRELGARPRAGGPDLPAP
ncbi:hypothetical protein [Allonocardiopsis opalescens]|uniref:DUF4386 family protein n=1 Tax=Allonocardiopsis opalescens TaxID=1144618 RepID=A0A2T0Q9G5_9ACTN|nr:hypothetical protein [Allonocardiopsis opalescens]PRY00493.1 hypothetical protein CLV72_102124 [Allonocardiopsis opalescens]